MSDKGPSAGDPLGLGTRPGSGGHRSTGTGDAPGRSSRLLAIPMASSPGHRHPLRQAGGGDTDRRLRPIPLSSEGVRGRSSTGSRWDRTRGWRAQLRRIPISSGSSTTRPCLLHKLHRELHRNRGRLLRSGPDQVRARARRSRARSGKEVEERRRTPAAKQGRTRRVSKPGRARARRSPGATALGKCEKGPHRYERQGPFTRRSQDRSPATPPTGTGDAPGRSSRLLRSRCPRHLAIAAPRRQAAEALCGSSSPTDPAPPGGRT
jgi:hypothetical protein